MAWRGSRQGGLTRPLAGGLIAAAAVVAVGAGIVYVYVSGSRRRARPVLHEERTPEREPVTEAPEQPAPVRVDIPERKPGVRKKPVPGLYGEAKRTPSRHIPSAVDRSVLKTRPWEKKKFFYIQTALHPALFMRARSDRVVFFHGLGDWGLAQPSFFVVKTAGGTRGVRDASFDGSKMTAPWIIASFAGSEGWADWDAPWLVVLQKRPRRIEKGEDGLSVIFGGPDTGYVMACPLYGYYKPPQKGREYLAAHGMPSKNIETWTWEKSLPRSVEKLVGFWAGTARAFPYAFEELFSIDRLQDSITFKQRHQYLENKDAWGTKPVKFAAIPHTLALAQAGGTFPMEFSKPLFNPRCMTAYGPFMGVVGEDEFTYTMHVLQYVNEKERHKAPDMDDPVVREAANRLTKEMAGKFSKPDIPGPYDHGWPPGKGCMGNYCWCIMGDCWYAKVLPYVDEKTRENVKSSLKRYFTEVVLNEKTYDPHRHKLLLHGPGIGSWGTWGDAGKFSMNSIHAIWCYGHYTGDWELLKKSWDMILKLNIHTEEMTWPTVGRAAIAEMGDEAEPAIALARIAWKLGDVDQYNYACYVAAKELVHHYVKQVGHEYFRRHQPYHEMGFIPPKVFVTNLWGSTAGWQIDGRNWTYHGGEHQSNNRWVRFHSEDVGRFYRDVLAEEVRAELDDADMGPGRFKDGKHWFKDDSHILPSFVRVRSLVLNESPEELAKWAKPSEIGGPTSGVVASMFSFIRTGTEIEQERLVPASGEPSPFVQGRERETTGSLTSMVMENWGGRGGWLRPSWHGWKSPKYPAGSRSKKGFTFGYITPLVGMKPVEGESWPLDWAGRVTGVNAIQPRKIPNEEELRRKQSRIPFRIVGPFPNPGGKGLATPYGPEKRIDLRATYREAGGAKWKPVTSSDGKVDLKSQFTPNEHVCAYAVTAVKMPSACKGILFIGSDDGVRVWLNGKLVHDNPVRRGVKPDEDMVQVEFRAGWNRILIKVEQGEGGWGLYLRIAHPDEGPFEDIEFSGDAKVVQGR